jgi:hypothetical protein
MGNKPKTNRTKWTAAELHLLQSRYASHGPRRLTKQIKRTAEAIRAKAYKLGLFVGDVQDWVPLSYIAAETGIHIVSVRERAKKSGFARHIHCNRIMVPVAWANAYIKSVKKATEVDALIGYYYTVETAAKIFQVNQCTMRRWLSGASRKGSETLRNVRIVMSSGQTHRRYLFEPHDVEREAKAYHERKANARD